MPQEWREGAWWKRGTCVGVFSGGRAEVTVVFSVLSNRTILCGKRNCWNVQYHKRGSFAVPSNSLFLLYVPASASIQH